MSIHKPEKWCNRELIHVMNVRLFCVFCYVFVMCVEYSNEMIQKILKRNEHGRVKKPEMEKKKIKWKRKDEEVAAITAMQ